MDSCTWTLEDPSNGAWGTECNNIFSLEDGTPSENRMRFCCFCGRLLLEQILEEEEEEEDDG